MSDSEDFGEPLKKTIPLNMNPYKFKVDQTQDLEQMVVKTSKFFDFEAITEPLERKRSLPEQDKETKRTHWDKEHEETISLLEFTVPKSINTAKGKSQLDELLKPVKEYSRKIDRARQCPVDPLCQNPLKIPYSKGLQQALDRYLDIKSKYERKRIKKEPLTKAAHYFCMYHKAEDSLIPDGLKKGYPLDIKFADISDRIHRMEHRIKRFLDPQHPSLFRSRVLDMYRTHGALKARCSLTQISQFSHHVPPG
ncbi:hypothetical protein EDD86DRAFT_121187 [Gorgonomyces haynaldii]|nr:hypothetical protein EDD86DRAFT_121187 [Gorgonomyces haynaldii]